MAETPAGDGLLKELEARVENVEHALEILASAEAHRVRSIKDAFEKLFGFLHPESVSVITATVTPEPEPEEVTPEPEEAEKPRRGRPSKAEKQEDE